MAICSPKPAHSGFTNMGWASLLYLPSCIFKAAILNHHIFFHCPQRGWQGAVVNSPRVKIGKAPWTRYFSDHWATCFHLTSPITTNSLALGCVLATPGSEEKVRIQFLNYTGKCCLLTCCCLITSVHVVNEPETWRLHVGCSAAINRGMWSVSTLAKVSKDTSQIGSQHQGAEIPGRARLIWKPTSLTK